MKVRVKITPTDGQSVWYVTGRPRNKSIEDYIIGLNAAALREDVQALYSIADEIEYLEYRTKLKADLKSKKAFA